VCAGHFNGNCDAHRFLLHNRLKERLLVRELVIERAARNACRCGDLRCACVGVAFKRE
jgi:hypothetical protein